VSDNRIRSLIALGGGILAVGLMAGCTSSSPSPAVTVTRTATAAPTTSAPPSPRPTPSTSTGAAQAGGLCAAGQLQASVGERDGAPAGSGNGMNQQHVAIIVTNTGSASCTLQGWPGVSLVGKGNGTQLGAAAQFDRSTPHPTVTIAAGGKTQAPLDYVDAAVYDPGECQPTNADGLRVYPPGSRAALFVPDPLQACASTTHDLLTVGAFVAYP
jgi:hypothetical protein